MAVHSSMFSLKSDHTVMFWVQCMVIVVVTITINTAPVRLQSPLFPLKIVGPKAASSS